MIASRLKLTIAVAIFQKADGKTYDYIALAS